MQWWILDSAACCSHYMHVLQCVHSEFKDSSADHRTADTSHKSKWFSTLPLFLHLTIVVVIAIAIAIEILIHPSKQKRTVLQYLLPSYTQLIYVILNDKQETYRYAFSGGMTRQVVVVALHPLLRKSISYSGFTSHECINGECMRIAIAMTITTTIIR